MKNDIHSARDIQNSVQQIQIVLPVTTDPNDRRSHPRAVLVIDFDEDVRIFEVEEILTGLRYPVAARHLYSVEQWERIGSPALATLSHS